MPAKTRQASHVVIPTLATHGLYTLKPLKTHENRLVEGAFAWIPRALRERTAGAHMMKAVRIIDLEVLWGVVQTFEQPFDFERGLHPQTS